MYTDVTILCLLTDIRGLDKQRNTSNHEKLQVTNMVERKSQHNKERMKHVRIMENLPLLTLQYHPKGRDLGRPKQRWKDQQHLQHLEGVSAEVNLSDHDDDDDGDEDKRLPEKC
jgi:hypothetical protein